MDIKTMATELAEKIQRNPQLLEQFQKEPIQALEALIGVDLPDAQIKQLAELIKTKIDLDKAGDLLKGLGSMFKK